MKATGLLCVISFEADLKVLESVNVAEDGTFSRPWCLLKTVVAINLENHWVDNFCLKFLYLGSFFFCTSVFRMLLWWISVKEASS